MAHLLISLYRLKGSTSAAYLIDTFHDALPSLQCSIIQCVADLNDAMILEPIAELARASADDDVKKALKTYVKNK